MGSRRDRAAELAAQLEDAGVRAFTDTAAAAAGTPCVLIPPPTLTQPGTYAGPLLTWQLVALASSGLGSAESWDQLDVLLDGCLDVLDVERAEPFAYALPDGATHPAYRLTITEG